jgi:excisionase family DNA binding protein
VTALEKLISMSSQRVDLEQVAPGIAEDRADAPTTPMPRLLRIPEAAKILAVSPQRAYELARKDLLPVVHVGRQVRVDPRRLEEWIANGGGSSKADGVGPSPR